MNARLLSRNLKGKRARAFGWHAARACTQGMGFTPGRRFTLDTDHGYQRRRATWAFQV